MNRIFLIIIISLSTFFHLNAQSKWEGDYNFDWQQETASDGNVIISSYYSTNGLSIETPKLLIKEPIQLALIDSIKVISATYLTIDDTLDWMPPFFDLNQKGIQVDGEIICERNECTLMLEIDPVTVKNGLISLLQEATFQVFLNETVQPKYDFKSKSILSEGNNYALKIKEYGMYFIDKDFLESNGLNSALQNPKSIKIYSGGGGILAGPVDDYRVDDYEEIPLIYEGLDDNKFDNGDKIIFYAEGPDYFKVIDDVLTKNKNPYGTRIQYILKYGGENAKQIQDVTESVIPDVTLDYGIGVFQHEEERENLFNYTKNTGTSGGSRIMYGELFGNNQELEIPLQINFPVSTPVTGLIRFLGRDNTKQNLSLNIQSLRKNYSINSTNTNDADNGGRITNGKFTTTLSGNPVLKLQYQASQGAFGFLDYITLNYQIKTNQITNPILFTSEETFNHEKDIAFVAHSDVKYINVTSPIDYYQISITDGKIILPFHENAKIIAYSESSQFQKPEFGGLMNNQNIHGTAVPNLLIISSKELVEEAQRLANHRSQFSDINVEVVIADDIFNEYGRGVRSPIAMRDFIKQLYERSSALEYLLLFGDGTFDFKNILETEDYKYCVPTYQTHVSNDYLAAFPSDDYFGLLNNYEGNLYNSGMPGSIDISIGRLPANSNESAKIFVDKIIHYDKSEQAKGDWKLRGTFISDDEDNSGHMRQNNKFADFYKNNQENFNSVKIHADAFIQEASAGGDRYPEATRKLLDNIQRGTLLINYLGHGSPKRWSQEKLLTKDDVENLSNINRLPLFITATCTYAPFDNPFFTSSGELLLHNERGGAIAIFSTLRPVFQSYNEQLVEQLMKEITSSNPENLQFGSILRNAKNKSRASSQNNRKFVLLGDPSQRLAVPTNKIVIDNINDTETSIFTDTIKALDYVKIEGHVEGYDGDNIDFNGEVSLVFYDKEIERSTLGQESGSPIFNYNVQESVVYRGKSTVKNGNFTIEFYLPKDINYSVGEGKLSFYAYDYSTLEEAMGYQKDIYIGGLNNDVLSETGPQIEMYMDDTLFVDGGYTNSNPYFLAKLKDDYGISVSGQGIGHDLIAYLDGDESNQIILNDYYTADLNNSNSGSVEYQLQNLSEGPHTITLRAWDISNNVTEKTLNFIVSEYDDIEIDIIKAFPNPFHEKTNFFIRHNKAGENLDIIINFYDEKGSLIKTLEKNYPLAPSIITDLNWELSAHDKIQNRSSQIYYADFELRLNNLIENKTHTESKTIKLLYIN